VDEDIDRVVMMAQELHLTTEDQGNRLTLMESNVAAAISNFGTIIVTNGMGGAASVINASASLGPATVDLLGLTDVALTREDDSGNILTVLDSGAGCTVQRLASITLEGQDDYVRMVKVGTNWKKIG